MSTFGTPAQDITAAASCISALALLLSAITLLLPVLRRVNAVAGKVEQVRVTVNGQLTALLRYQATLIRTLDANGIPLPAEPDPPPPSIPPDATVNLPTRSEP